MEKADGKVRGTTEFSFTTSLSLELIERAVQEVVSRFRAETPITVTADRVYMDTPRSVCVELVIATSSYAEADEAMRQLCEQIVDRFRGDGASTVDERSTELVPA
jgi:acetamidase/formamidase